MGRKVSKARLLANIYETAHSSIGLPVPIEGAALSMFRMVLAEGRSFMRQRDAIEKEAHAAGAYAVVSKSDPVTTLIAAARSASCQIAAA